jgi:DNA-binding SARP family transcriptional activator
VVEFNVLGPVEVVVQGEPLGLGGPKQRAIVALLAANVPRVVSSDQLMEAVWGDEAAERTSQHLQTYVSNLRRVLDPAIGSRVIVTRAPGYALDVDPATVDLHRFGTLADHARALVAEGDDAGALAAFAEAESLWRGDLAADLQFEPVMDLLDPSQIEEERHSLVEERVDCQLRLGLHGQMVGEVEALVRAQPLRERRWSQLVLALYRSGRQADALAAYTRARDLLRDELGLDPSDELRDLERRILDHDPTLDVVVAAPPAAATSPVPPRSKDEARGPLGRHRPSGPWTALHGEAGPLIVEAAGGTACVRVLGGGEPRTISRARIGGRIDTLVAAADGRKVGAWVDGAVAAADAGLTGQLRWSGRRTSLPAGTTFRGVSSAGEPITGDPPALPEELAGIEGPWSALDEATSARGSLLAAAAGAGSSTLHLLLRRGSRAEHRVIDAGVHLDRVVVARPLDGRSHPTIVFGGAGEAVWWWSWEQAGPGAT